MDLCQICNQEHGAGEPCRLGDSACPNEDPLLGRVLEGKYELEYLISRGGMASVYCARRRQIGDLVAVKILLLDENCDPVDLKRFKLEAATAASIKHTNIVAIHDFGVLEDIAFIVMERLEGPSLAREIRNHGTIALERSITVFKQVCAAVSAAHKMGVVHRDLKPSNIIFQNANCEEDLIKVVDFGIAKLISAPKGGEKLTAADLALGTPEYISPEQCLGHKLDERSDIYSLGIVLYEMLTGEVPFYNEVASAILVQHAIETPRSMTRINPAIPKEVDAVVMKALEKNRENRYRTALEMATEFELACRNAVMRRSGQNVKFEETPAGNGAPLQNASVANEPPPSKREPLPFKTGFTPVLTPTEGVKATGARARVRFSFDRFIGREEELKQLDNYFQQVCAGQTRTVFIIGDPGLGKTELVNQFHKKLGLGSALFLVGKFYEYGSDSPYRPYLDSLYSFTRNFPERNDIESWPRPRVEGLTSKIREGLEEVDIVINSRWQQPLPIEEQTKYRTFELLASIYTTAAEATPVILFLDDLQWADSLSLEFLAYLVRNTESERLLIIGTVRSQELLDDARPIRSWLRRISKYNGYEQIRLASLSDTEVRSFIDSIFGNIIISESVIRRLNEVTQGNPFYLGEIIRQLIQDKKIVWTGERWLCADINEIELPGSILDLVELHLKRLTDETIEVFTRAAVVGEKFSLQLLGAITDLSKDALMDIIDIGLREFIIKESTITEPFADDYFIFYHGTLRKVLYERLSSYRRKRLHAQIADKLEKLNPRKLDRVSSQLAHHYYHGAIYPKALHYGLAAGDTAFKNYSIEEAIKYYAWADEAIAQLAGSDEAVEIETDRICNLRLTYGDALMHMGKNDDAQEQFELGLRLSTSAHMSSYRGKILGAFGELCWSRGQYKESLDYCQEGLKHLGAAGDMIGECRLLGVIGNTHFSQGQFEQAVEVYNKRLEQARKAGDRASEGEALRHIGWVTAIINMKEMRAHEQTALKNLDEALTIAREIGDRENERQTLMFIGNVYFALGQLDKAAEHYQQSLAIARAIGRRRGECRVSLNIGEIYRMLGELEDAQIYFSEAHAIAEEIEDRETEGHTLSNLGLVYQDLGDHEKALESFQRALKIFRETSYRSNVECEALSGIARILWQQDKVSEAKSYFEMAIESGRELGLWMIVVPSLRCLAACEKTLEHPYEAKDHLIEAINVIDKLMTGKLSHQEQQNWQQIKSEIAQELATLETSTIH